MNKMEKADEARSPGNQLLPNGNRISQEAVSHWLRVQGLQNVCVMLDNTAETTTSVQTICDTKRTNASGDIASEKNEDTGIVREEGDTLIAAVFDGATNIGAEMPISPGKAAAVCCREVVASVPVTASPREMLLQANSMIRSIAAGLPLSDEEKKEVLTAVGVVAKLDKQTKKLHIASIGDCHVVVLHSDGTFSWLTENTSSDVELHEIAAAVWCAENKGNVPSKDKLLRNLERVLALPSEDRPVIRSLEDDRVIEVIESNRRMENTPAGQPSLKGSDDSTLRIQENSVQIKEGDRLFLFTDGGYPGPLYRPEQREEVAQTLREGGIDALHETVREMEDRDPELRNPPRMKQYDDLVALQVEFGS